MSINLVKGGNINLSKEDPGMEHLLLGLGWNPRATDGQEFDLDASVFMVEEDGKIHNETDFIFYKNTVSTCGSVKHGGDNRTGDGDGDDETINVDLKNVPARIARLVVTVSIYDAATRGQNFGMVSGAYMRAVNAAANTEVAKFDLSEDMSTETAMIFGEIYRHNGEWKFKAVGQGFAGGLEALVAHFSPA